MAPSFSQPSEHASLPPETIMNIAGYVSLSDLRSMVLSSWYMHDTVVPILYRSLDIWIRAAGNPHGPGSERWPFILLTTLIDSATRNTATRPTRRYVDHVVTLSYTSRISRVDLCIIPLLAACLCSTVRLRHLCIELDDTSIPLLLDAFRRKAIIRAPPPSMLTLLISEKASEPWLLPRLESVRSPQPQIVEALMRYRAIKTAVIDSYPEFAVFDRLFAMRSPFLSHHLTRLSIVIESSAELYQPQLKLIAVSFPSLEHLFIRPWRGYSVDIFLYMLEHYFTNLHVLPCIRVFSVLNGAFGTRMTTHLRMVEDKVNTLGNLRPNLTVVILGRSAWTRREGETEWVFHTRFGWTWLWLSDKECGMWRSAMLRPMHRSGVALVQPSWPMQITQTFRESQVFPFNPRTGDRKILSVFERFMLSAPEHVVDALFSRWSPDLIMRLRCLSSSMLFATEAYCDRLWNIETFLRRWFRHPASFLAVLAACDGIISGSEAQQFFARRNFLGNDLDIYVPCHGVLEMGRWLQRTSFIYQPAAHQHPLFDAAVMMRSSFVGPAAVGLSSLFGAPRRRYSVFTTFTFVRPACDSVGIPAAGSRIQVIAVRGDPVNAIINHYHSTGVMNYITATYAVALFPRTTFVDYTSLVCTDITQQNWFHRSWMKKYRERGFKVITAYDNIPTTTEVETWSRRVGDGLTWVFSFARSYTGMYCHISVIPFYNYSAGLGEDKHITLPDVTFEVLPVYYRVAPAGAALRIGPRFVYSSMAMVKNPWVDFPGYRSLEVVSAFSEFFDFDEADQDAEGEDQLDSDQEDTDD
ncbi:hypothetical protein FKP32DRAFT_1574813 [Trametes sanguinea]|nr:hypothetical protein FKP32DRAFT_1574813 [Trametes sanguinea]